MALFEKARYEGEFEIGTIKLPISFDAEIDDTGTLNIALERMPITKATLDIHSLSTRPGRKFNRAKLTGTSARGTKFSSESFLVTGHMNHFAEDRQDDYVQYSGHCTQAEIRFNRTDKDGKIGVAWRFRRLQTFTRILDETDLGPASIGGAKSGKEYPQLITGTISIHTDKGDNEWLEQAISRLDHITRVISIACGLYLKPYVEHRWTAQEQILTVTHYGNAHEPSLGAFHDLHLDDIFKAACQSTLEVRSALRRLDNAIQWVLTPAYYTEIRLIGAMTAIEAILETALPDNEKLLLKKSSFEKIAKIIRTILRDMHLPDAINKIPELNRRKLEEKLRKYLVVNSIDVSDLPADSAERIIKARNNIVHRGIYEADETEERGSLFDCALLAREIVTRILLTVIQFNGKYISIYFGNDFRDFKNYGHLQ